MGFEGLRVFMSFWELGVSIEADSEMIEARTKRGWQKMEGRTPLCTRLHLLSVPPVHLQLSPEGKLVGLHERQV